jgi:RimJ/RimL family protein N-acetyltransferase
MKAGWDQANLSRVGWPQVAEALKRAIGKEDINRVAAVVAVGLQPEGRLWDKEYFKGRWWDTLLFAILEDEWKAR